MEEYSPQLHEENINEYSTCIPKLKYHFKTQGKPQFFGKSIILYSRNQVEKRSWSYLLSSKIAFICQLFCNLPFLSINNSDCRECSLVLDDRTSSVDAIFHFGCTLSLYQGQSGVLTADSRLLIFQIHDASNLGQRVYIQAKFPTSNFNLLTFMRVFGFRVFGLGQKTAPN